MISVNVRRALQCALIVGFIAVFKSWHSSLNYVYREAGSALRIARDTNSQPTNCVQSGQISLTYDGGVDQNLTPMILNSLDIANAPGTFFFNAQWLHVGLVQAIVQRVVNSRHTLGLLYTANSSVSNLTTDQFVSELNSQASSLGGVGNVQIKFVRLPWNFSSSFWNAAAAAGYVPVSYAIDTMDENNCNNNDALISGQNNILNTQLAAYANAKATGSFIVRSSGLCNVANAASNLVSFVNKTYSQYTFQPIEVCRGSGAKYRNGGGQTGPTLITSVNTAVVTSTTVNNGATSTFTTTTTTTFVSTPTSTNNSSSGSTNGSKNAGATTGPIFTTFSAIIALIMFFFI